MILNPSWISQSGIADIFSKVAPEKRQGLTRTSIFLRGAPRKQQSKLGSRDSNPQPDVLMRRQAETKFYTGIGGGHKIADVIGPSFSIWFNLEIDLVVPRNIPLGGSWLGAENVIVYTEWVRQDAQILYSAHRSNARQTKMIVCTFP
ncbi:hypothetical protein S7711_10740 [Stachybotrys chartarum IBT 7711]|uniref:Uncharacterized protein n=1 Tax=Stachybotrys chartarum (strain CBS 109288 / IBT 7711) TaxID=1280523 RepID=A0A084AGZ5_STACB|nr:hypothetical protein S7711_10740 [Stachybotrys chartarum IBT 7711]KFA55932.1 hypothetical protein S40293_11316 [Stachybotrys chartarum IBT 40293]